jgi:hypothetical protein
MANQMYEGRTLFNSGKIDISDGAAHNLAPAAGSGKVTNLHFISISNTSANPTNVTITDGINTLVIGAPASAAGMPSTLPVPFQSSLNTAITAQATSGQTSVIISAQGTIT